MERSQTMPPVALGDQVPLSSVVPPHSRGNFGPSLLERTRTSAARPARATKFNIARHMEEMRSDAKSEKVTQPTEERKKQEESASSNEVNMLEAFGGEHIGGLMPVVAWNRRIYQHW